MHRARWPALALTLAWLSGCAMAPGMSMNNELDGQAPVVINDTAATEAAQPSPSSAPQSSVSGDAQGDTAPSLSLTPQLTPRSGAPALSTTDPAAANAPPSGSLLEITPELIRLQRSTQAADISKAVRGLFGAAAPYLIGPGDVLNIVVWDHPELALAPAGTSLGTETTSLSPVGNGYNVSQAGQIQFPYVGVITLSGLTELEASETLTQKLAKYIKNPRITLRIQAYRSGRVYVDGEVRTPGLQAINDIPMTLPEAINRAGGFTTLADRSGVIISRRGKTTPVDLMQLVDLGINPSSIMLKPGDMVRVLSRDDAKVYIMGEVTRPTAQTLRNGRLSLNEALGEAGGVSVTSGNPKQIYVVRAAPNGQSLIYHLNAGTPAAYALAEGFALRPRDVVYVDPTPLVQWNRVISQILPSASIIYTTGVITNQY